MGDYLGALVRQVDALSLAEMAAFLLGAAYLVLAIRESLWCWIAAFLSASIFAVLFAGARIYMDSALQLFYAAMAVYGWWSWRGGTAHATELDVTRWPARRHLLAMAGIVVLSLAAGSMLVAWTDAKYPYVDSFTTFASLWATFLVARKVLENWWYWLVIDAVSIAIYLERGLAFAAALFVVYVVMIPFGLAAWTRSWRDAGKPAAAS
jgi:nicotinamide mononucleotide transporter